MKNFQPMKQLKKPSIAKMKGCKLKSVFQAQRGLLQRYDFYSKQAPEELTKTYVLALLSELDELLSEVNWKPWKKTKKTIDLEELRYEIIDIFTFTLSLMIAWGMTEEECFQYFMAKNKENLDRIERGY